MAQNSNILKISCHKVRLEPLYLLTIEHQGGELRYNLEESMGKDFGLAHAIGALMNLFSDMDFLLCGLPQNEVEKCEQEMTILQQTLEIVNQRKLEQSSK